MSEDAERRRMSGFDIMKRTFSRMIYPPQVPVDHGGEHGELQLEAGVSRCGAGYEPFAWAGLG